MRVKLARVEDSVHLTLHACHVNVEVSIGGTPASSASKWLIYLAPRQTCPLVHILAKSCCFVLQHRLKTCFYRIIMTIAPFLIEITKQTLFPHFYSTFELFFRVHVREWARWVESFSLLFSSVRHYSSTTTISLINPRTHKQAHTRSVHTLITHTHTHASVRSLFGQQTPLLVNFLSGISHSFILILSFSFFHSHSFILNHSFFLSFFLSFLLAFFLSFFLSAFHSSLFLLLSLSLSLSLSLAN